MELTYTLETTWEGGSGCVFFFRTWNSFLIKALRAFLKWNTVKNQHNIDYSWHNFASTYISTYYICAETFYPIFNMVVLHLSYNEKWSFIWLKTRFQLFFPPRAQMVEYQQEGTFPLIIQCTYETSTYSLSVGVSQKKTNWLMRSSKYQGERERERNTEWRENILHYLCCHC